jgi:hypothetical protein
VSQPDLETGEADGRERHAVSEQRLRDERLEDEL